MGRAKAAVKLPPGSGVFCNRFHRVSAMERAMEESMNTLPRVMTGAAFAVVLGAGMAALGGGAAQAAMTLRDDCLGDTCVRTTCDDDGVCTKRTTYYDTDRRAVSRERVYRSSYRDLKPMRYACDVDGDNCHYTRSYYIDEDGNAVYDSGVYP
jgi:hypothetical protein